MNELIEKYKNQSTRPIKFGELEVMLLRYDLMLQGEIRYSAAEFIIQENYRRILFDE